MRYLLPLLFLLMGANLTPTVSWTPPTTNIDGSAMDVIDGTWVQWIREGYNSVTDIDGTVYPHVISNLNGQFGGGGVFAPGPLTSVQIGPLVCGKYWIITYVQERGASLIGPTTGYGGMSAPVSTPVEYDTGIICPPSAVKPLAVK